MVDTMTREFMIAHLVLHGWAPVDITHTMIVNVSQRLQLTAIFVARRWYPGTLTAYRSGDMPTPSDNWDAICTTALEVMFKELTRDESVE